MKFIRKYKSGFTLKLDRMGYYRLYRGRVLEAWKLNTRKDATEMIKYLLS